ncbi:DUF6471 domain-containing protein [Noviherbaspirillum aridicola]|uniref:DUF6471 domain-containing protein n=1 Tax=Noviherbaspirillum aridicola TaxID=2849687 RepID=UPI001C815334|nr:DUF6471 domain-containing protein [Noviherbaspirillum aridicola]
MDWHVEARRTLRAELVRRGVSVEELSIRLAHFGVKESPQSLAVKISRGRFQLAFFLQCMAVIGGGTVTITLPPAHSG